MTTSNEPVPDSNLPLLVEVKPRFLLKAVAQIQPTDKNPGASTKLATLIKKLREMLPDYMIHISNVGPARNKAIDNGWVIKMSDGFSHQLTAAGKAKLYELELEALKDNAEQGKMESGKAKSKQPQEAVAA